MSSCSSCTKTIRAPAARPSSSSTASTTLPANKPRSAHCCASCRSTTDTGWRLYRARFADRPPARLSPAVRAAIEEPNRRLHMRLLSRASVQAIVGRANLSRSPNPSQIEAIFSLCGGHPLALGYVINQLRHRVGEDIDVVLSDIEPFQDHIDVQYASHWHQVEANRDLTRLLALLARVRGAIEIRWVETWQILDSAVRAASSLQTLLPNRGRHALVFFSQ